ncbi:hypothetical protein EG832_05775 [bacterium]|nr:hypothetical protein [bacterium]
MRKFIVGLLLFSTAALSACGGSGNGGTAATETATGSFIDAPVQGITYESGSQRGVTGADGSFTYEVGKTVKFTIGDIVLGEATGQPVLTPVDLAPAGSDETTPEVLARVQLLMSLSSTDPAEGKITIPPDVLTAARGKSINFATASQTDLADLVMALIPERTLVSQEDAQNHLSSNYTKLFTVAKVSGKTLQMVTDDNGTVTYSFNTNGTLNYSSTTGLSGTGSWVVNHDGTLTVNHDAQHWIKFTMLYDNGNSLHVNDVHWDGSTDSNVILFYSDSTSVTAMATYTIDNGWTPLVMSETGSFVPTNSLASILNEYTLITGCVLGGIDDNYGLQFCSDGTAYIYSITADEDGVITNAEFVTTSAWKYVTINSARLRSNGTYTNVNLNGASAILVSMSPVKTKDFFLVVYNGLVRAGRVE